MLMKLHFTLYYKYYTSSLHLHYKTAIVHLNISYISKHRAQIFKKVGVKLCHPSVN